MNDKVQELPGRLHKAFDYWTPAAGPKNKKEFAKAMAARMAGRGGQSGVSYQSILSYLDGNSVPTLEWLAEAADLTGVRFEWLVLDEGEPTQAEELIAKGWVQPRSEEIRWEKLTDLAFTARGYTPGTRKLFMDALHRYMAGIPGGDMESMPAAEICEILFRLLDIPRDIWGFSHDLTGRRLNDFTAALLHALMIAMPEDGEGDSLVLLGTVYASGYEQQSAAAKLAHKKLNDPRLMERVRTRSEATDSLFGIEGETPDRARRHLLWAWALLEAKTELLSRLGPAFPDRTEENNGSNEQ